MKNDRGIRSSLCAHGAGPHIDQRCVGIVSDGDGTLKCHADAIAIIEIRNPQRHGFSRFRDVVIVGINDDRRTGRTGGNGDLTGKGRVIRAMQGAAGKPVINFQGRRSAACAADEKDSSVGPGFRGRGIGNAHGDHGSVVIRDAHRSRGGSAVPDIKRIGADGGDDILGNFNQGIIRGRDRNIYRTLPRRNGHRGGKKRAVRAIGRGAGPGNGKIEGKRGGASSGEGKGAGVPCGSLGGIRIGGHDTDLREHGVIINHLHDHRISRIGKITGCSRHLQGDGFRTFRGGIIECPSGCGHGDIKGCGASSHREGTKRARRRIVGGKGVVRSLRGGAARR